MSDDNPVFDLIMDEQIASIAVRGERGPGRLYVPKEKVVCTYVQEDYAMNEPDKRVFVVIEGHGQVEIATDRDKKLESLSGDNCATSIMYTLHGGKQ